LRLKHRLLLKQRIALLVEHRALLTRLDASVGQAHVRIIAERHPPSTPSESIAERPGRAVASLLSEIQTPTVAQHHGLSFPMRVLDSECCQLARCHNVLCCSVCRRVSYTSYTPSYKPEATLLATRQDVQSHKRPKRPENKGISFNTGTARNAPVHRKTSFDVLHLLPHLLDDDFHINGTARRLQVLRLG